MFWIRVSIVLSGFMAIQSSAEPASEQNRVIEFNIPRQSAVKALVEFAEQAEVTLVFPFEETSGITTNLLQGEYTMIVALGLLLADTSLASTINDGQVNVSLTEKGWEGFRGSFFGRIITALTTGLIETGFGSERSAGDGGMQNLVEEIVVTAQRREQKLQDVGIAVSSFSSQDIKNFGMLRPEDIAGQTPGLDVKNSLGSMNPVFTIRGIGLNDYNINNNPSVGVYVDEIYMASAAYLSFQVFDLERIEVLKGPQGTLYGRNTTGGAINFLSAKPTKGFEAYLNLGYSRWNTLKMDGAVSGSVGANLTGRLAFQVTGSDGYYKNNGTTVTTGMLGTRASALDSRGFSLGMPAAGDVIPVNPLVPPDDDFLEQDLYSFRGTLVWQSKDRVEITSSVHYTEDASDMFVRSMGSDSVDLNGFSPADNDPFTVDANFGAGGSTVDIEGIGGFVKVDIDFDFGNLISVTGYEAIERTLPFEESSPYRILDQLFVDDLYEWSQEVRLQIEQTDKYFWLVGAYLGKEKIKSRKDINSLDSILRTTIATEFVQEGTNHAVFSHSEWQLSEATRLTVGLRYSHDSKRYSGGSFIPVAPYGPYGVDLAPAVLGVPLYSEDSFEEDDVSGKIGIDWKPSDDLLFYLTWSKGYKSGGYDGSTITSVASFEPFFGESVYAWEAGLKSVTSGRVERWNLSYFSYDYQDMQAEAQRSIPVQGAFESIRANVGEGAVWGLESDIWLKPASGLNVRFGISYVNSKISDWHVDGLESFDPEVVAEATADIKAHIGNAIPDAPQLTVNGLVSYTWRITPLLSSKIVVDFNYTDEVYKNIDNDEHLKADSYWLLNARVTIAPEHARWEVSLWGKNLNDELYFRERFDNFGSSWIYETPGAPLSFGVTVGYRWP